MVLQCDGYSADGCRHQRLASGKRSVHGESIIAGRSIIIDRHRSRPWNLSDGVNGPWVESAGVMDGGEGDNGGRLGDLKRRSG